jgi:hypothetical protein
MDPRDDDDIQFDFFEDEPATAEAQSTSRVRMPRRGGRGPGSGPRRPAGPAPGLTPILRLLALIAVIVAILVFFGLLLQSCAATSKHDTYQHYMSKVATIAKSSEEDGTAVANALVTPAAKATTLGSTLGGLAEQERQNVAAAGRLSAPGPLRDENQRMIEALQLRVSGVQGLADTFTRNPTSKATGEAQVLSEQADRLLASDVVWDDLFSGPLQQQLTHEGVSGVSVPDSNFVSNRDLTTERSMSLLLTRLKGASTGGTPTGIHGTNIVDVKVLPGNQTLSTSTQNTITATTDLAFVVTIDDSGDSQEVGINVTLTIQKSKGAIVKTKKLDLINPGQQRTVTFSNLGTVPFAQTTQVLVDVAPVPGEHNTSNNKASFPAIFSLP